MYERYTVKVTVASLALIDHTVRPPPGADVAQRAITTLLQAKKYGENGKYISVGLNPTGSVTKREVLQSLEAHEGRPGEFLLTSVPGIRVVVLDGARRLKALQHRSVQPHYSTVRATLYLRKDTLPFQIGDAHTVGYKLNNMDRLSERGSGYERAHAALSTLRSTLDLEQTALHQGSYDPTELAAITHIRNEVTTCNLRRLTLLRGLFAEISPTEQQAYCEVALGLFKFPSVEDLLQVVTTVDTNNGGLTLMHVCSADFWAAKSEIQLTFSLYSLSNICKHLHLSVEEVPIALKRFMEIWAAVEEEFAKRNIPENEGFALSVKHPQDEDHTDVIITRMAEWMEFVKREELENDDAWRGKTNLLLRGLRRRAIWREYALPDDSLPVDLGTAHTVEHKMKPVLDLPVSPEIYDMGTPPTQSAEHDERPPSTPCRSARLKPPVPTPARREMMATSVPLRLPVRIKTKSQEDVSVQTRPAGSHGAVPDKPIARLPWISAPDAPRRSARISKRKANYVEQSISEDTDDLQAAKDPNTRIPSSRLQQDCDGFQIVRRWKTGFVYERPTSRITGFVRVVPDSESESGALIGEIPGTNHKSRLYRDQYNTTVKLRHPWRLYTLPPASSPVWSAKYNMPTSRRDLCDHGLPGQEAFLRSLGFRPPHQCFWRLNLSDISEIRWSVFRFFTKDMILPNSTEQWQAMGEAVFKGYRRLLDAEGYIVLPEFVRRDAISPECGAWANMFNDVKSLFRFFDGHVPKTSSAWRGEKKLCWERIRNDVAETAEEKDTSDSRWTTTSYATNTLLESKENVHLLRARCYVEVSIWTLLHYLHLEGAQYEDIPKDVPSERNDSKIPPMYATDSGSRVLCTSKNCSDQIAHTDFMHPRALQDGKYPETIKFPGYFTISMGPQGGRLWILKDSHRYIFFEEKDVVHMSKAVGLTEVELPPWSTILARGDFIHAGMGHIGAEKMTCVRLHDYMLRKGLPFADTIDDKGYWKIMEKKRCSNK